jgi:hypothetical protein
VDVRFTAYNKNPNNNNTCGRTVMRCCQKSDGHDGTGEIEERSMQWGTYHQAPRKLPHGSCVQNRGRSQDEVADAGRWQGSVHLCSHATSFMDKNNLSYVRM